MTAAALLATTCSAVSPDWEASVRGNNETGRYVASITNNTDTDLYATCYVNAVVAYGSIGFDRFLMRGVAGATSDHQGSVRLDDAGAEYEIQCVKEFSVEPNATVDPLDRAAAAGACSTTYRLYALPRSYADPNFPPEKRVRVGRHMVRLAERSGDAGLVAATRRLLGDVNDVDWNVLLDLFARVDDACDGLGFHVGTKKLFEAYYGP